MRLGTGTRLAALLFVFALVAAACGDSGGDGDENGGGDGQSGSVIVSGSSTVEPISAGVMQLFATANPAVQTKVDGPGTGDGFKLFCSGQTDISDASRAIKDSERDSCAQAGIEFIELNVAVDGLSVLTSTENAAGYECLAVEDLYALLGPESIGYDTWDKANDLAAEIGAPNAPYPAADLAITAPGEESGTYDTFVEFIVDGVAGGPDFAEERGVDSVMRPDYVASANDNQIIAGIAGSSSSLGWVGYAFFLENEDQVKALQVDAGAGCVAPSAEAIAGGTYPLSRPLYIYVNADAATTKPEVASYIDLYLSDEGLGVIADTGYVPLDSYDAIRSKWEARTTG